MYRPLLIRLLLLSAWLPAAAIAQNATQLGVPPWQEASNWPDRTILTFTDDPAHSVAVTWRTDSSVSSTIAQIAPASADARFDVQARTVLASTEALYLGSATVDGARLEAPDNAGLGSVHYHSAILDGLEPDTLYAYRVQGAEGAWSEWFQTRTAAEEGPVKFVYLGDAQNGILSHWSRVLRAAMLEAPDARFYLHAGDMVNRAARDFEWAEWYKATGFLHGMVPAVPVVGNHEVQSYGTGDNVSERVLTHLWRPQFTLPVEEELPLSLQETVYDVRYNEDVHLFVLNSLSSETEAQARWLDRELSNSDAQWRIVSFHFPIFSSAIRRDGANRRDVLLPILRKHQVDLVLQGHDHSYARGALGQAPERFASGEGDGVEVMFVNSVSGAKMYDLKPDGWDGYAEHDVVLQKAAENTPFFQVISIEESRLNYEAWTADGQLYDYFEMIKGGTGLKSLSQGDRETMAARRFDNSGEYENAEPL